MHGVMYVWCTYICMYVLYVLCMNVCMKIYGCTLKAKATGVMCIYCTHCGRTYVNTYVCMYVCICMYDSD